MSVSPGRRFMIDLLVSSLMADGGLESALNAAITAEIQVSVEVHESALACVFEMQGSSLGREARTSFLQPPPPLHGATNAGNVIIASADASLQNTNL